MRLLGYTRVSTNNQDPQLQIDSLLSIGVQKRDIYGDVMSGRKNAVDRPGMQTLLAHADEGDTIVVWRIDRLGRSLLDVLHTVSGLQDRGIQVRSISDGIDPANATGRLMLNLLATLAEYERELIVERVRAGVAVAQEAGAKFGRPRSDPAVVAEKLAIVAAARADGKTAEAAAALVGWSRPTLYRHSRNRDGIGSVR
ncbi:invertase (plasmid) [Frondihabitans sp. PAMC 28766]|uniref:recombinase family protein n=1 Tax=Frondihabitans sp. PAMC 28766 TaxID=1795630 RepID=UPI00078BC01C|nr:recombinase family protein [Frondihabitans sp. PAMC 28766]AMM22775.1 invertase [Frondihabitans sp. PAMC 28766]